LGGSGVTDHTVYGPRARSVLTIATLRSQRPLHTRAPLRDRTGNVPPFTFGVRVTPQGGGMITLPINSESEFNAVLALLQTPGQLFFDRGALIKNG
jgi:hypothetical protein